jgi:hypothetical protein
MKLGRSTSGIADDWSREILGEIALLERVTAAIRQATADHIAVRSNTPSSSASDAASDGATVIDLQDARRKRSEAPLFF